MKVIAFKNEEEYYHVVRKIKKMKRFLTELCNVIEDSHSKDEDYEIAHRKGGKMKGGRFSY